MNTVTFLISCIAALALVTAWVVRPLLRARVANPDATDEAQASRAALKAVLSQLESDKSMNKISETEYNAQKQELLLRARSETSQAAAPANAVAASAPARTWLAVSAAFMIPALAFCVYLLRGNPAAIETARGQNTHAAGSDRAPPNDAQIEKMVAQLQNRLKETPDDVKGWLLLGRTQNSLGKYAEAAQAYERAIALDNKNPDALADAADSLAMLQDRSLAGKPIAYVEQALKIAPTHQKSLALAATHALNTQQPQKAKALWGQLLAALPNESEDAKQVKAIIAEIDAGKSLPGAKPSPASAASGKDVAGTITVSKELHSDLQKLPATATLYVFARRADANGGPPLAVWRTSLSTLPMKFKLDDSMSMTPSGKLSDASALTVEARVSMGGGATPVAGDVRGGVRNVPLGAQDIEIVLSERVK